MTELCRNCQAPFDPADIVCPQCGMTVLTAAKQSVMECQNHPQQSAIACCIVCGKPVCGDCTTTRDGVCFCSNPEHQKIHSEWELLMRVKSEFESDMICRNLQQAGIETVAFAQHVHSETFWLGAKRTVRVFVRRGSFPSGRSLLESLGLHDTFTE